VFDLYGSLMVGQAPPYLRPDEQMADFIAGIVTNVRALVVENGAKTATSIHARSHCPYFLPQKSGAVYWGNYVFLAKKLKNPCSVEFVGEDEKQGFKMTTQKQLTAYYPHYSVYIDVWKA